jgi:hypothetical protein
MRHIGIALMLLAIAPIGQPAQKQQKKKAAARQVVTGCMDEKPEAYVLRNPEDPVKELAQLEPVGFEKAIFARYVGHKVSVSGELAGATEPPTLRVTSPGNVKDIAEICSASGAGS